MNEKDLILEGPSGSTEKEGERQGITRWLDLSEVLVAVPAYLYVCSFQFEKGACGHFHIPVDLIEVDLVTTLTFTVYLFAVVATISLIPITFAWGLYNLTMFDRKYLPYLRSTTWAVTLGVAFLYLQGPQSTVWDLALAWAVALGTFNLAAYDTVKKAARTRAAAIGDRPTEGIDEILKDRMRRLLDTIPDVFYLNRILSRRLRPRLIAAAVLLLLVALMSYRLGELSAIDQTSFETSAGSGDWVLLKKYGDDLIFKKYMPATHSLSDSLKVLKVSEFEPIVLGERRELFPGNPGKPLTVVRNYLRSLF